MCPKRNKIKSFDFLTSAKDILQTQYIMFCRYSDDTIRAVEMLDGDEKIDLDLIVSLIRHIVLNEDVS